MSDASQIVRQWQLARAIGAAEGQATIKTLAELTGRSEKTIRRDIAQLQAAGFPIVESIGEFGRKTYAFDLATLPPLMFTYDEALALFLARAALTPLAGTYFWDSTQQAFRKIKAALGSKILDYVEQMLGRVVQTRIGGDYSQKGELLDQLVLAIEENKAAFITYRSERSTEPVTYDIHPYGLIEHRGSLYVVGYSPEHKEVRKWKLDRMLDAEVTKFPFQRPEDFSLEQYLAGSFGIYQGDQNVLVQVRFSSSAARYVSEKQMHASQQLTPQADGSLLAEYRLSSTVELKSWLLSFGAQAEVLSPPELREEMAEEAKKLLQTYDIAHHSATMARTTGRQRSKGQTVEQARKEAR